MKKNVVVILGVFSILLIITYLGCKGCARKPSLYDELYLDVKEEIPNHFGVDCMNDDAWEKLVGDIEVPKGLVHCNLLGVDGKLYRDSVIAEFGLRDCGVLAYKIYLEASGSMKSYDDQSIAKGLRAVIREFYTRIDEENPAFSAWVTDKVYPDSQAIHSLLQGNPSVPLYGIPGTELRDGTGTLVPGGQTDFKNIFTSVLSDLKEREVALVVSDMVYSEKGLIDPEKLAGSAGNSMRQIFRNISDEYEVLVVQFSGDYKGYYYSFAGKSYEKHTGKRPFYFVFIGMRGAVTEMVNHKRYITEWGTYPDHSYRNRFLFRTINDTVAEYCYLGQSSGCKGRFASGAIEGLRVSERSGDNSLFVAVNLKDVYAEENYLTDVANYDLGENDEFELEEVLSVKEFKELGGPGNLELNDWEFVSPTHVLKLRMLVEAPKTRSALVVRLKQRFPKWVVDASTLDDSNINDSNFSTTTFGLKEMMDGLFKAYYRSDEPTIKSFAITFKD